MNLLTVRQRNSLCLGTLEDGHLILLEDLAREAGEKTGIVSSMERLLEGGDEALLFVSNLLKDSSGHRKSIQFDSTLLAPLFPGPARLSLSA